MNHAAFVRETELSEEDVYTNVFGVPMESCGERMPGSVSLPQAQPVAALFSERSSEEKLSSPT